MTATLPNSLSGDGQSNLGPSCEQEAEAQFLARLRAGDEEASATLVRKYGGRMLAVARRFLRCEEDSADAVQEAFLARFVTWTSSKGIRRSRRGYTASL